MDYHSINNYIQKILNPLNQKIRKGVSIKFDKSFSNNKNKALLESLQDYIDDDLNSLDIAENTKLGLPVLNFSKNRSFFDFQFVLSLSNCYFLSPFLSLLILFGLLKLAQIQLKQQNKKILKVA